MSDEKPRKFAEGGIVSGSAEPLFKPDRCEPIIPAATVREVGKALLDAINAESTSAALRRVEQERDELATALDREHVLLKKAEADRSDLRPRVQALEAELVSARQELDAVRTARDNLGRDLAEARATIRALTRTGGTAS